MATSATTERIDIDDVEGRIPSAPSDVGPSARAIAEVVATIVERFHPALVTVFGSRVYGTPRADSDVDLMVVMETALSPRDQARLIEDAYGGRRTGRIHTMVRTPGQIRLGLAEGDFFVEDAVVRGVVLHRGADTSFLRSAPPGLGAGDATRTGLKRVTRDWIAKAEDDFAMMGFALTATEPIVDGACFHAQQCVEKYLKAYLQQIGVRYARTHDLAELADAALGRLPELAAWRNDLAKLTPFATVVRYVESSATPDDAERAERTATEVRWMMRTALGLPSDDD